jgi:hypothetical protein
MLLMPSLKHFTHGISNLVSLITKTKLGLSHVSKNIIPYFEKLLIVGSLKDLYGVTVGG